MKNNRSFLFVYIVLCALVVGFAGTTYWYYQKYVTLLSKNPQSQVVDDLLKNVSRLIVLPENESPTVATVSDLSKLKNQPFFANAHIGDKVLIYTNARKAILYSPTDRRIIEVAPLNIGGTGTSTSASVPSKETRSKSATSSSL